MNSSSESPDPVIARVFWLTVGGGLAFAAAVFILIR